MSRLVFVLLCLCLAAVAATDEQRDCGPNAHVGCKPDYCGGECDAEALGNPRLRCPHVCFPGGCRCDDGFKYDRSNKLCVPADQCPPAPPANDDCEK